MHDIQEVAIPPSHNDVAIGSQYPHGAVPSSTTRSPGLWVTRPSRGDRLRSMRSFLKEESNKSLRANKYFILLIAIQIAIVEAARTAALGQVAVQYGDDGMVEQIWLFRYEQEYVGHAACKTYLD
jgi:hypothetical protein